jgi:hypothetical protein
MSRKELTVQTLIRDVEDKTILSITLMVLFADKSDPQKVSEIMSIVSSNALRDFGLEQRSDIPGIIAAAMVADRDIGAGVVRVIDGMFRSDGLFSNFEKKGFSYRCFLGLMKGLEILSVAQHKGGMLFYSGEEHRLFEDGVISALEAYLLVEVRSVERHDDYFPIEIEGALTNTIAELVRVNASLAKRLLQKFWPHLHDSSDGCFPSILLKRRLLKCC